MSRTRTLAQLRADVCYMADIVDGGTDGRHTTDNLNRRINEAIQQFKRLVSDNGNSHYMHRYPINTNPSTTANASGWAPCDYLLLPSDFYHLVGVDINVNGETRTMSEFMRSERNMFRDRWQNDGVGVPQYYRIGGFLENLTTYESSLILQLIPRADAVYSCTIWYLPIAPDMTQDSDTFDGVAGYEDWVVNRAVMDALLRDGTNPAYQAAAAENQRLEQQMTWQWASTSGPGRRVDSRGIRERMSRFVRWNWGRLP